MYLTTLYWIISIWLILCQGSQKKATYSTRGRTLYTVCPFLSFLRRNRQADLNIVCDSACANDVTESINYKLHSFNRKLITEVFYYFCHKSTFEDKLNVCRQTGAGMQFHFINICFRCFEKGACAFIVYVRNSGFSWVFAIFRHINI